MKTTMGKKLEHRTKFLKPFISEHKLLLTVRDKLTRKHLPKGFSLVQALALLLCAPLITSAIFASLPGVTALSSQISLSTNNSSYQCMQSVGLYANLTSNGVPISNGLVAVEVDWLNTTTWTPILIRSLRGSQKPSPLDNNIRVLITPVNINWIPQKGFTRGTDAYFNVTLVNSGVLVTGLVTWSVLDAALVPLWAGAYGIPGHPNTINPGLETIQVTFGIPSWAAVGTATIYVNVFTDAPSVGGYPIINETACTFQIESSFGPSATTGSSVKSRGLNFGSVSTDPIGLYNSSYRVPPVPVFGTYVAYAAASNVNVISGVAFQVIATSTAPSPSFTYLPQPPYVNGTVYFDASGSFSYNGTITNYSWNWGDGSSKQNTSSPYITHIFHTQGTYSVTLNVTDSQKLWAVLTKPVWVSGPTPPVASFTFNPNPTWTGAGTKFNASTSSPGWNGAGHPPIVSYIWNFGDGSPANTTSNNVISHQFTTVGNFTTTLTVKDNRGWNGTTTQIVQVKNPSSFYPSVDVIVTGISFAKPPTGLYQIAPNYYQPYKGWVGNVSVTILNNGTTAESFTVNLICFNATYSQPIGTQNLINLAFLVSTTVTCVWNTSLLEPTMNYTINASTSSIPGETNSQNEQYSIIARVKGPGDILGVGVVNLKDLGIVTGNWKETVPPANPLADPLGVGVVNLKDLGFVTGNWKKSYS